MRTDDLMELLRKRFAAPEWALFTEVGNATGGNVRRHADAIAMNLWPSRGMELHGFELKVSRGDWLRELKAPAKAEAIYRFCDRWWVAAADTGIVLPGELPATWGLLVVKGGKLVVKTDAPRLEAEPLTRGFIAAVLRRAATENASASQLDAARKAAVQEYAARAEAQAAQDAAYGRDAATRLRRKVDEFEAAAGVSFDTWQYTPAEIGAAVRAALAGRALHYPVRELDNRVQAIARSVGELRALIDDAERSGNSLIETAPAPA